MQVQTSEQTFFNFLILGKSRFPSKKSFITLTTESGFVEGDIGQERERERKKFASSFGRHLNAWERKFLFNEEGPPQKRGPERI